MANGRLSFSIALNLASQGFKQGAAQVKNALRNIQYQVLGMASALGLGGIGLSNLVSRFVDVARETNRARMALRNISVDSATFGKNMDYLTRLAQQYGQNLNTLTSNFSRFSAASNAAGVSLEEQQGIYSSVTKAITAFGLSGEEANLTFMALGQMMAKGKISSEELRRQMGERIPTAMQAMANAAGVSIQQLDKMLKNGEIYSKDILPKFAKELDKLTGDINVDNLETSVNRLATAFIKLTEDLRIGEFYKKLVDGTTNALSKVQGLLSTFAGFVVGGVLAKLIKGYMTYSAAAVASHNRVALAGMQATWKQELALSGLTKKQQVELLKQRTAITSTYLQGASAISKFGITAMAALRGIGTALMSIAPMAILMALGAIVGKIIEARKETERMKKLYSEYRKEVETAGNDDRELIRIRSLVAIMNDKKTLHKDALTAQTQLLSILGLEYKDRGLINDRLRTKIGLLKAAAKAEVYSSAVANSEKEIGDIAREAGISQEDAKKYLATFVKNGVRAAPLSYRDPKGDNAKISVLKTLGVNVNETGTAQRVLVALEKIAYIAPVLNDANHNLGKTIIETDKLNKEMAGWSKQGDITPAGITPKGGGTTNSKTGEEIVERIKVDLLESIKAPSGIPQIKFGEMPKQGVRDTTFDYKKSDLDKLGEQKDILEDYIEKLRKEAPQAIAEIAKKEGELTSLSEAMKLAELKEDIENFNKELLSKSIDGITGLANSIDTIANSWERVANADVGGWEQMIAIINAMGDSIKGITNAWETYQTIKDLIDMKEKASAAQALANAGINAAAAGTEAQANVVSGAAKTFNAHAAIPFVGIGLAAAGIAAMIAMIAKSKNSIPKFADGGIIGGSSYTGDKILGRFNSGERVLTRPDQARLTRMLRTGTAGGGQVEFVIKGKDLVGTLNQQQQKNSRR